MAAGKSNLSAMVSGLIDPISQQLADQKASVATNLNGLGESAKTAVMETETSLMSTCQHFHEQATVQYEDQELAALMDSAERHLRLHRERYN